MKRNYKIILFLLLAIPLYIYFMFYAPGALEAKLQYAGILLCLLVSFWIGKNKLEHRLVQFALVGTAVADSFLLWPNGQEVIGVAVFLVVQGLYAYRLHLMIKDSLNKNLLLVRIIITLTLQIITLLVVSSAYDLLVFVTILYFAQLLSNIIVAFFIFKQSPLLPIAFSLFMLCDVIVGLYTMQPYLTTNLNLVPIIGQILASPYNLAWLFYYPSQVLIVLSIK